MSDLIDFEAWQDLARTDPEAFEAQRRAIVEAVIERVPPARRQRLRCLQWRIERVCAHAANPLAASLRLSQLMWESVNRQQGLIQELLASQEAGTDPAPRPVAKLLHFPKTPVE